LRLERQPVLLLGREYDGLLKESRRVLGAYLNADVDDLVYIPNATHGATSIAHSVGIKLNDQVLTTSHEDSPCGCLGLPDAVLQAGYGQSYSCLGS
jgi:isopenicillin-N epimerase